MANAPTEMAIFERVAERGSFARAAEDVGLSPSAVAKLITRLERGPTVASIWSAKTSTFHCAWGRLRTPGWSRAKSSISPG
jgi:hypothetical protein